MQLSIIKIEKKRNEYTVAWLYYYTITTEVAKIQAKKKQYDNCEM